MIPKRLYLFLMTLTTNIQIQLRFYPFTSTTRKIYPFEVFLKAGEGNLETNSKVKANQIRTIDKKRLGEMIGKISKEKMQEIEKAILIHLDIKIK